MPSLLETAGSTPQKQPRWVPLFLDRAFTGMVTQRSVLHDSSTNYDFRYLGGRPDALWQGKNIELTNRLSLQRRPGLVPFSAATYPTVPDRAYSFQLTNGTIRIIIDTISTGFLSVTSVNTASGTAIYTGTFPCGGGNAFVGLQFTIAGFTKGVNNGTFIVVSSSATTLELTNSKSQAESAAATAISYGAVYWDQQNGSKTLLFDKGVGAGQAYFQAVSGILYIGDGVDTRKWTPLNPNLPPGSPVSVWNWGIAAPPNQPSVTSIASGVASTVWQANTIFSTMGLTVDANGNAWQLIGVNADPVNNPNVTNAQFGTAGNGNPPWNQALYGTTTDGALTWKNLGVIQQWQASHQYGDAGTAGVAAPVAIYDPASQAIFLNFRNAGGLGTSGLKKPAFAAVAGSNYFDDPPGGGAGLHWFFFGTYAQLTAWVPSHAYTAWYGGSHVPTNAAIEPFIIPPPTNQPIYLQVPLNTASSGASYTPFPATPGIGDKQPDGQLLWLSLGSTTWTANTNYIAWTVQGSVFSVVQSGGLMHVCVSGTRSGSSVPTFGTTYGGLSTLDGDIKWVCVGPQVTWVAGSATTGIWNLPLSGFQPPQTSQAYGGSTINSSTNLVETVIVSGKSGGSAPSWNALGTNTTDGGITWFAESPVVTKSLSWTTGLVYAYAFKSMSFTDFYAALPLGGGNTPPGITSATSAGLNTFSWTGIPTGSATGAVSTASPVFTITGGNVGAVNTVTGLGSLDPQVDTIVIYRSTDGGGFGQMFELTEIPAPKPIDGIAQTWSFKDFLPQNATALYPGLNTLIPAPINHVNDMPPSTFLPMAYNFQRIWGADGELVEFSGGPDTRTGNPNEAFPPVNTLPFLAPVIRLVKTPQGLATFLTDSIEIIAGGPLTSSFFSVTWAPGVGLLSFNALDILAGEMYFFSADNQFRIMTPSLNIANAGFALGDQFANLPSSGVSDTTWDPTKVYVASHQNGIDNCIFVADGSTGWYRLNAHQAGAMPNTEPVWSPFAAITNGVMMVQSVEVRPGIKRLLVGAAGTSGGGNQGGGVGVNLLTATTYGVLAGTTVTNTGATTVNGDLGLTPGSAITGAPTVTGATNVDNPAAIQAQSALTTAYNAAAALPGTIMSSSELGGLTLPAGVYASPSGAFSITSVDLTLDAGGNSNAFWVFQMASTLIVGNGRTITLINGAQAKNVFWQVGSSATIGTTANFKGTILALTSITIQTSAVIAGRALARNGAVTMDTNTITSPSTSAGGAGGVGVGCNKPILQRDLTVYTDNGTQYDAFFVIGSIMLCHPGQISLLKFCEFDFSGVSFQPTISYLLNEISGPFVPFTRPPQFDPPSLYGTTVSPLTYSPNRYYFLGNASLARCRHLQVKCDFGITPNGDEMLNATIFGRVMIET